MYGATEVKVPENCPLKEQQGSVTILSWVSYNKKNNIMAEKLRKAYIDIILRNGDNDNGMDREFLETLTLEELRNLSVEALNEINDEY